MPRISSIPSSRVPLLDDSTGLVSREWFTFFQKLFALTGNGVVSPDDLAVGGMVVPDFTMTPTTPVSRRLEHPDTNPRGWNAGSGMMTFKGKFKLNNYLAANPTAHFVVALRCDTDVIHIQPRFHGVIGGNLTGSIDGAKQNPAMQIESRATGLDPGDPLRMLFPNAWTPSNRLLQDGVLYDLVVESKLTDSGRRTVRFVLSAYDASVLSYNIITDTGDCLDPNTYLDMTKHGLVFASVFESDLVPWTIDWSDMTVTWSSAPDFVTDGTERLSRYGDTIDGNLQWTPGSRLKVYCTAGSVPNWTLFQSQTVNTATYVTAIPNGTSTAAALIAANNSNPVNFSYASVGMNGNRAELTTLNLGTVATPPPLDIKIGATTIATFDAAQETLNGNLLFSGNTRSILVNNTGGGAAVGNWTRFKTSTTNENTTVLAVPDGTATASNFLATNTNATGGAYGYTSLGMNAGRAELTALGMNGGGVPPLDIKIGTTTHTFSASGLMMATGTENIGLSTTRLYGLNSFGGAEALTLTQNAQNMENYCTPGTIATALGTTYSASTIETALRPAYGMLSNIYADLKARGIL